MKTRLCRKCWGTGTIYKLRPESNFDPGEDIPTFVYSSLTSRLKGYFQATGCPDCKCTGEIVWDTDEAVTAQPPAG